MKRILIFVFLTSLGATVFAQGETMPQGKWWRQQRVIQELSLTQEQQSRLDAILNSSAEELIDLKAEVDKRGIALRREIDQPDLNRQAIQRAAASLSEARGRLFQRELMMFVDMRGVLSVEQWSRFRSVLDARDRMRDQRKQQMRPGYDRRRPDKTPPPRP